MPDSLACPPRFSGRCRKRRGPLVLKLAKENLHLLFGYESSLPYSNGRFRAMREERRRSIRLLVSAMLGAGCLQFDGAPCQVTAGPKGKEARPLTVPELAHRATIGLRTAERCLQDLREAGMMTSLPQIRRREGMGMLVAPKLRNFTEIFWRCLGLWSMYRQSVIYATTEQAPIRLRMPMKQIGSGRRNPVKLNLPDTVPKAVPMEIQTAALSCFVARGGTCDAPENSPVCRHCREARMLA